MLSIVKNKKIFFIISIVLMVASAVSLLIQGFNLDTDFAGGVALTVHMDKDYDIKEIENLASEALGADRKPSSVQASGNNNVIIKFGYDQNLSDAEREAFADEKIEAIRAKIDEKYGISEISISAQLKNAVAAADVDTTLDNIIKSMLNGNVATPENAEETETTEATETAEATEATEATETVDPAIAAAMEEINPSVEVINGTTVNIKFGYSEALSGSLSKFDFRDAVINALKVSFNESNEIVSFTNNNDFAGLAKISPQTGIDLAKSAALMSLLAALAILVYVAIRFDFTSGVCAVLALVHDILILCGIYSICRIAIDTNFIAALLTVLGYSINATIVIFDRIRENTRHAKKSTYGELANLSINQTLTRSVNTTITTLLTIGMVYLLGVTSIKVFALPIIIGIAIGTYSSICIAGPVWSTWKDAAVNAKAKANAKK